MNSIVRSKKAIRKKNCKKKKEKHHSSEWVSVNKGSEGKKGQKEKENNVMDKKEGRGLINVLFMFHLRFVIQNRNH